MEAMWHRSVSEQGSNCMYPVESHERQRVLGKNCKTASIRPKARVTATCRVVYCIPEAKPPLLSLSRRTGSCCCCGYSMISNRTHPASARRTTTRIRTSRKRNLIQSGIVSQIMDHREVPSVGSYLTSPALSLQPAGPGGGGWHKALVVSSVSLWRRLLASRP